MHQMYDIWDGKNQGRFTLRVYNTNYFYFLIKTHLILFEAIPLRSDEVMAIKPFTFGIWGKNLSLLIGSIPRSYYTLWKIGRASCRERV